MYVIKHPGHLRTLTRNDEDTRLRLVFSTFPWCSQMPVVFYHSVIHSLKASLFVWYIQLIIFTV